MCRHALTTIKTATALKTKIQNLQHIKGQQTALVVSELLWNCNHKTYNIHTCWTIFAGKGNILCNNKFEPQLLLCSIDSPSVNVYVCREEAFRMAVVGNSRCKLYRLKFFLFFCSSVLLFFCFMYFNDSKYMLAGQLKGCCCWFFRLVNGVAQPYVKVFSKATQ